MSELLVYITTGSRDEAERLACLLIEQRLAACANILAPVTSLYKWKGDLIREEEVPFIAKTTGERFEDLCQCIREAHSYETPCIVSFSISQGDPSFLQWINDQVSP